MNKENKKIDLEDALRELEQTRVKIERDFELGHELIVEIEKEKRIKAIGFRVVAVAAVLAIAVWVFGPSLTKLDSPVLYSENYSKLSISLKARSANQDDILKQAIGNYQQGNVDIAISIFSDESLISNNKEVADFYLALCYLEKQKIDLAEKLLSEVRERGDLIQPELNWYLALIHLNQQDYSSLKQELKTLKTLDQDFKKKERKALMRKIRFR